MQLRWYSYLYAKANGYFWLPCPVCGNMFGGHEMGGGRLRLGGIRGKMTCPNCPGEYIETLDGRIVKVNPRHTVGPEHV